MIWRSDAVKACREAAGLIGALPFESRGEETRCNALARKLEQLATLLDHGGGDFPREKREPGQPPPLGPKTLDAWDRGEPNASAPVNEEEEAHRSNAVRDLVTLATAPSPRALRISAEEAVTHIVHAAAHRCMAQVIGAIDKVNARPKVNVVGYDALRAMVSGPKPWGRTEPKPKARRRRKAARR